MQKIKRFLKYSLIIASLSFGLFVSYLGLLYYCARWGGCVGYGCGLRTEPTDTNVGMMGPPGGISKELHAANFIQEDLLSLFPKASPTQALITALNENGHKCTFNTQSDSYQCKYKNYQSCTGTILRFFSKEIYVNPVSTTEYRMDVSITSKNGTIKDIKVTHKQYLEYRGWYKNKLK